MLLHDACRTEGQRGLQKTKDESVQATVLSSFQRMLKDVNESCSRTQYTEIRHGNWPDT